MQRIHVSLHVQELDPSVAFYSALFGTEPTTRKADYAKWMLEDPRVNFSISDRGEGSGFEHLGIQAETPEELAVLRQRIAQAGGLVRHEGETTCCYHESDKTWVTDAQGVSWEAFYTSGEAETFHAPGSDGQNAGPEGACCSSDCCSEEASALEATA